MQTISVKTTRNVFTNYLLRNIGERIIAYRIDWLIPTFYTIAIVNAFHEFEVNVPLISLECPGLFFSNFFEIFLNVRTPDGRATKIKFLSTGIRDYQTINAG